MRVRAFILSIGFLLAVLVAPAHAQDAGDSGGSTTSVTEKPEGVGIGDGYYFTGAVITPPDGGPTRTFDAYQAAVFVQSWLPSAFFGGPDIVRDPPPELPVHRIDITGDWGGQVGTVTVYYAVDGRTPYIAFPQTQGVATDPSTPPPAPADWFTPPERVIEAFAGEAELFETAGTQQAGSTPTSAPVTEEAEEEAAGSSDSSSSTPPPWVWGLVAAAVAAVAVVLIRRRRTPPPPPA